MTPKNEDSSVVWVRHKITGTMFLTGLANIPELGDDYEAIESPDNPVPVAVKQKAKAAVKAQEQAQEDPESAGIE